MKVSRDTAFLILSKWRTESIPIDGVLWTEFFVVKFGSCKVAHVPGGFSVIPSTDEVQVGRRFFELTIDLEVVSVFGYGDPREAPDHIRKEYGGIVSGLLTFQFPNGAYLTLIELAPNPTGE